MAILGTYGAVREKLGNRRAIVISSRLDSGHRAFVVPRSSAAAGSGFPCGILLGRLRAVTMYCRPIPETLRTKGAASATTRASRAACTIIFGLLAR